MVGQLSLSGPSEVREKTREVGPGPRVAQIWPERLEMVKYTQTDKMEEV